MSEQDIEAVHALGQDCFDDEQPKPHKVWSTAEATEHLRDCPALCWVAEAEGRVVGFALGSPSFDFLKDAGHLEWVAVAPGHRRHGVATSLAQRLTDVFHDLGKHVVIADVASANGPVLELVGKLGFQQGMAVTFCWKVLP